VVLLAKLRIGRSQVTCTDLIEKRGRDVPDDSDGRVAELKESVRSARYITKCRSSGSDKLYQSMCGHNCCNNNVY
jgi:hypothetical protein